MRNPKKLFFHIPHEKGVSGMQEIRKTFRFEAAHRLPSHQGACQRLHGHSYKLEVGITGGVQRSESSADWGMIMDFGDLKRIVNEEVLDVHDHQDLNKIYPNPTAENMVREIAVAIQSRLPAGRYLTIVKLWETESSHAIWRSSKAV